MYNPFKSTNLTVIDSVMGRGKSTWAIQLINSTPEENYIIVVPTLDEVDRYHHALTRPSFIPNREEATETAKSLQDRFKALAEENKTIITTHRMLECWDSASLEILRGRNYTLILDEVTDLVRPFEGVAKRDYQLLLNDSVVAEERQPDGLIKLVAGTKAYSVDDNQGLKFSRFMEAVNGGNIYKLRDSFFLWVGSPERFRIFDAVYVMTYLFKGSVMDAWFTYHGDSYLMKSIVNGDLVDYIDQGGNDFKDLIRLVEDKQLNHIGRKRNLSSSWYDKAKPEDLIRLKTNLQNFFRGLGVSAKDVMWSVFRGKKDRIVKSVAPAKFTTTNTFNLSSALAQDPKVKAEILCYVPVNIKASNHYRHKKAVAICTNCYAFPSISSFFQDVNIYFDVDRFALSEMIQVIWRSRIREGKDIDLYIPSERMRNLFKTWLNSCSMGHGKIAC